jgi:hypothetical protein
LQPKLQPNDLARPAEASASCPSGWDPALVITSRAGRAGTRRLAGDDYTAIWARRRIREQRLDVVRANARSFATALVVGAALIIGVALLVPWRFVQGLIVGVGITALLSMIGFLVLALSGTTARGMGATAEAWTAGELRRLHRHGWRMINGLVLPGRDVDHLLLGPVGVIVVETKWSSTDWHVAPADENVLAAVDQAVANARSLRLWQTIKRTGLPVRPLVVLWGGSKTARQAKPVTVGDATVAYGLQAIRSWMEDTKHEPKITAADDIDRLMQDLEAYLTSRREMEPALIPPPSIDRAIWVSLATLASFTVTVLTCLEAFTISRSWWVGLGAVCGVVGIWLVVYRRWTAIRVPAIGGLLGVMAVSTLAAVAAVVAALR